MFIQKVVQVLPIERYKVLVQFSDGKITCFDALPLLKKTLFKKLAENDNFFSKAVVLNNTLAWDFSGNFDETQCLDVDPVVLYNCLAVTEEEFLGKYKVMCGKFET